jgi:hypothetical protein
MKGFFPADDEKTVENEGKPNRKKIGKNEGCGAFLCNFYKGFRIGDIPVENGQSK